MLSLSHKCNSTPRNSKILYRLEKSAQDPAIFTQLTKKKKVLLNILFIPVEPIHPF